MVVVRQLGMPMAEVEEQAEEVEEAPETIGAGQEFSLGDADQAVYDVVVEVSVVLGTATMKVSEILKMGRGAVVQLDRGPEEAVDVFANDRLVAHGDVVVIEDHLAVTLSEIVKSGH